MSLSETAVDTGGEGVAVSRPVLRYHGGKWRLARWIISHFPSHRIYVEPFGGAASVLMQKPRAYAEVYNDLDGEVVNVFRVLRDPDSATRLEHLLRFTPFAREEFVDAYKPSDDPVEQARRTVVKSFMGFGSAAIFGKTGMRTRATTRPSTGFRSNTTRSATTPAFDWTNWPDQVRLFTERLQGVVIENRRGLEVIASHDRNDTLFYVDPPYAMGTRDNGTDYRHEMNDDDHRELADVLHSVDGSVVLSGYPCALYDELYRAWRQVQRKSLADGARKRTECLWLSPSVERRTQQVRMVF